MKIKTLPAAVACSLAAHGLALALMLVFNGNGTGPGHTPERVPFIQASLVYAMNGQSDRNISAPLPEKKKRVVRSVRMPAEVRPPDGTVTDRQAYERAAADRAAAEGAAEAETDVPVSVHLPAAEGNGVAQLASLGAVHGNPRGDGIAGGASQKNEGAMIPPRYLHAQRPAYPLTARLRGYEGVVLLAVEVLADGRPGRIGIKRSSGYALLDQSALSAVRAWRFEPARAMDVPRAMTVDVPVRFALNDPDG